MVSDKKMARIAVASGETIADRIRFARLKKGWAQTDLSERSGVPLGTVRNVEQSRVGVKLGTILKLFHCLGISVDELNLLYQKKTQK